MDIALAIERLLYGAEYFGSTSDNTKESYSKIDWRDTRKPKPTWEELEAAWAEVSLTTIKPDLPLKDRVSAVEDVLLLILGGSPDNV